MKTEKVSKITIIVTFILCLTILGLYFAPDIFYHFKNRANRYGHVQITSEVQTIAKGIRPIDLHADLLLWNRDIQGPNFRGHLDFNRLIKSNYQMSVFSTVTKIPKNRNYFSNRDDSDILSMLMIAQRWPQSTWYSPFERALFQASKLKKAVSLSTNQVYLIKNSIDILTNPEKLGIILATEGMNLIEGDLENAQHLYDSGFRMFGLTHFTDNSVGGSAHGEFKIGLTSFGRQLLSFAKEKKVIIDLAHSSEKLIDDVLTQYDGPVIVSHTGVQGTCPSPRNLSDDQIRKVVNRQGIIGIAFFPEAICDYSPKGIVDSMEYVEKIGGIDVVALGSDFEGSVKTDFDVMGTSLIIQEMWNRNWPQEKIEKVMFKNAHDFFIRNL